MKKELAFIFVAVFVASCSSSPDLEISEDSRGLENLTVYDVNVDPMMNMELVREISFGSTEEVSFGGIVMLSVDSDDRVYITDIIHSRIAVFNPDGTFHSTFGQRGEEPGEFRSITEIWDHDDSLYVYDMGQQQINVFTMPSETGLAPTYLHSVDVMAENLDEVVEPEFGNPIVQTPRSDGSILVRTASRLSPDEDASATDGVFRYHVLDTQDSRMSDVLFEHQQSKVVSLKFDSYVRSYFTWPLRSFSNEGQIITAWSDDFLIQVHDSDGTYLRSFYYPVEKPVSDYKYVDNRNNSTSIQQALQTVDVPETWRVMQSLLTDDENRIWARIRTADSDTDEWWVMQDTGELISKFAWPRGQSIQLVKNGYAYTREIDEWNATSFVRYRIEMEESDLGL